MVPAATFALTTNLLSRDEGFMDKTAKTQAIEQFQLAFARDCEAQIEQVIRESRNEALALTRHALLEEDRIEAKNRVAEAVHQFQLSFRESCNPQIQRLIGESRKEAFAEAKSILRDQTLKTVLQVALNQMGLADNVVERRPVRTRPGRVQSKKEIEQKRGNSIGGTPTLSDRVFQEIEAIQEKILKNEQLLNQIKPLVQSINISKE